VAELHLQRALVSRASSTLLATTPGLTCPNCTSIVVGRARL
jgi:hypothetical protein